jgi:hypothetical protein
MQPRLDIRAANLLHAQLVDDLERQLPGVRQTVNRRRVATEDLRQLGDGEKEARHSQAPTLE